MADCTQKRCWATEGFSGIQSILYHYYPPTRVKEFHTCYERTFEPLEEPVLQHRHFRTQEMPPSGDAITGRVELMFNQSVAGAGLKKALSRSTPQESRTVRNPVPSKPV